MEKLIELLNEYDKYRGEKRRVYGWTKWKVELDVNLIIFKKFGFIKWLVENDKIERPEIRSQGYTKPTYGYTTEPYTTCKSIELANTILMILAIKDEPINFLISILK